MGAVPIATNRRDHYLPQGYLRCFIDPAREHRDRPLWYFDIPSRKWSQKSPKQIGFEDGFYDFGTDNPALEHPDVTFGQFERQFPPIREQIKADGWESWIDHKPFLLSYIQMMRARSPLFFAQQTAEGRKLRGTTIKEVHPQQDGTTKIVVESLELKPFDEGVLRNRTISMMQQEINKGPDWMANFDWCLRWTNSTHDPVITAEHPVVTRGPAGVPEMDLTNHETLIFFPLCWQACMIGGLGKFDQETDRFAPEMLESVRQLYRQNCTSYLVSPQRVINF